MSEQQSEAPVEPTEQQEEVKTFDSDYVDKLRKEAAKYRTEARANSDAAKRLAEIEEANKTESQKAADRLAAAEREAAEARTEALRYRVATELRLDDEDAEALKADTSTEEGIRLIATRLAAKQADRKKQGNHVPREGASPSPADNDERAAVRELFG